MGEFFRRAAALGFEVAGEYAGPLVHNDGVVEGRTPTFRRLEAFGNPPAPAARGKTWPKTAKAPASSG